MDFKDFKVQLARLENQWKAGYGEERGKLIWQAFKSETSDTFRDAVSHVLMNCRSVPLMKELSEAVQEVKRTLADEQLRPSNSGVMDVMQNAADKTPNKDLSKACMDLLAGKMAGKYTMEQFVEGCDLLDKVAQYSEQKVCKRCSGGGYVTEPNEEGYRILMRCTCHAGNAKPHSARSKNAAGDICEVKIPSLSTTSGLTGRYSPHTSHYIDVDEKGDLNV